MHRIAPQLSCLIRLLPGERFNYKNKKSPKFKIDLILYLGLFYVEDRL